MSQILVGTSLKIVYVVGVGIGLINVSAKNSMGQISMSLYLPEALQPALEKEELRCLKASSVRTYLLGLSWLTLKLDRKTCSKMHY